MGAAGARRCAYYRKKGSPNRLGYAPIQTPWLDFQFPGSRPCRCFTGTRPRADRRHRRTHESRQGPWPTYCRAVNRWTCFSRRSPKLIGSRLSHLARVVFFIDHPSTGRHTPCMNNKSDSKSVSRNRQIVGFSLPPELAAEVKAEAARRNIRLRTLFTEMWANYKSKAVANDR